MFTPHSMSHVMCHVSHVTCHVSCVTCHNFFYLFFYFFIFGQSGEAYRWRVCYQRGLPRLVFIVFHHFSPFLLLFTIFQKISHFVPQFSLVFKKISQFCHSFCPEFFTVFPCFYRFTPFFNVFHSFHRFSQFFKNKKYSFSQFSPLFNIFLRSSTR